jgi:hypothetical protein
MVGEKRKKENILMLKTVPSVGTPKLKEPAAAPTKVIWASNWRFSRAGAAEVRAAKRVARMVRVRNCILMFEVVSWEEEEGLLNVVVWLKD